MKAINNSKKSIFIFVCILIQIFIAGTFASFAAALDSSQRVSSKEKEIKVLKRKLAIAEESLIITEQLFLSENLSDDIGEYLKRKNEAYQKLIEEKKLIEQQLMKTTEHNVDLDYQIGVMQRNVGDLKARGEVDFDHEKKVFEKKLSLWEAKYKGALETIAQYEDKVTLLTKEQKKIDVLLDKLKKAENLIDQKDQAFIAIQKDQSVLSLKQSIFDQDNIILNQEEEIGLLANKLERASNDRNILRNEVASIKTQMNEAKANWNINKGAIARQIMEVRGPLEGQVLQLQSKVQEIDYRIAEKVKKAKRPLEGKISQLEEVLEGYKKDLSQERQQKENSFLKLRQDYEKAQKERGEMYDQKVALEINLKKLEERNKKEKLIIDEYNQKVTKNKNILKVLKRETKEASEILD
jgi:hypothetical protein